MDDRKPIWKVKPKLRINARALRRKSTDAERILWASLRDHRLKGFAFRRQVPIANYVADFVCHAAKLVVELDGGQHFSNSRKRADKARSAVIAAKGFRVLRFGNHEVMHNRIGVLEAIAAALTTNAPTPALPRKRERRLAAAAVVQSHVDGHLHPRAGILKIGGNSLEYRMIGPAPDSAPTLVLLHEGLGSAGLWGDFPDKLQAATGAGVFVYSRAGYGASSPASLPRKPHYMHTEALEILPKLLDAIGFRKGLLVGHSDGASIAAIYAGGVQDHRIRGLVLIAPHFIVEDISVASIAQIRQLYQQGNLKAKLARWHSDVDNAFYGWNSAWLDPAFRDWDISEYLAYLRVPVAILQGEQDQYGTIRQIEIAQEECYCPVDVSILSGAGHSPHRETPEATLNAIAQFAERILHTHEGVPGRAA